MHQATIMLKFILLLVFAIFLLLANYFFDFMSHLSPDAIQEWLLASGRSAPLVYMSIMAVAIVISTIPSLPLDIAAGAFSDLFRVHSTQQSGPWLEQWSVFLLHDF